MSTGKGGSVPRGRHNVSLREFQEAKEWYRQERDPAGASLYTEEDIDTLDWFWHWMHTDRIRGDMGVVSQRIGYDASKVPQILRGKYGASIGNFLTVVRQLRTEVDLGADTFVETVVTQELTKALDIAYNRRFLGIITGRTGRSKTITMERYCELHNHGQTVYVRCRSGCTRTKLVRLVAMSLGRSASSNARTLTLEEDIFRAFNERRRRMLIIDEANHMLRLQSTTAIAQAFEFVRDLYDCCNLAVVLVLTDYNMDAFTHGKLGEFFEQLRGRCQLYREIPDKIFADEIRQVCAAYVPDPPEDLLKAARQIAESDNGKLRTLFEHLNLAADLNRRRNLPITGDLLASLQKKHDTGGQWPAR